MTGAEAITIERQRQIAEEGYDAEHDAGHADELARAAAVYAAPPGHNRESAIGLWPWDAEFYKPEADPTTEGRIRTLVKAGALIAAAIDSLAAREES